MSERRMINGSQRDQQFEALVQNFWHTYPLETRIIKAASDDMLYGAMKWLRYGERDGLPDGVIDSGEGMDITLVYDRIKAKYGLDIDGLADAASMSMALVDEGRLNG